MYIYIREWIDPYFLFCFRSCLHSIVNIVDVYCGNIVNTNGIGFALLY